MPASTPSQSHHYRMPQVGAMLAAALCVAQAATADLEPTATITVLDLQGMAPFAVHVHALETPLGVGTPLTARYQWDFGDPLGSHNTLNGWSAGHLYEQPGEYILTLEVANEAGLDDTAVVVITIVPDSRRSVYVACDGDDQNDGETPLVPIQTFERAIELLDDGAAVRFRRGDVFDIASTGPVNDSNILFTAYGEGADPVLRWTGSMGTAGMIEVAGVGPHDIVVEDLHFDSIYQADAAHDVVDAVYPGERNTTVARCRFTNLSYAVNGNRSPRGVLCMDNVADSLGNYFLWAEGSDYTIVNNVVGRSIFEHNLRIGGADRILIAGNDLTNDPKRTIWAMLGSFCYVTGNVLTDGRITVGPNPDSGDPLDRFTYTVLERNLLEKTVDSTAAVEVLAGAEHSMLRNNIILADGVHAIAVTGADEVMDRTSIDTSILNNTGINNDTNGRFIWMSADAEQIRLVNNLYVAPNLITGENQTANVYVLDDDVESFTIIRRNVWTIPDEFVWVDDGFHYVWPYWSDAEGYYDPVEWHMLAPVDNDAYERIVLDELFAPPPESTASSHGQPIAGVFDDFHGSPRQLTQAWTAGAVELDLGGPVDGPEVDADLNNDGVVDALDLIILIGAWGQTDSPADLNQDGIVDAQDLLILLGNWDID